MSYTAAQTGTTEYPQTSPPSLPSAGSNFTDPDYGTTICRVTGPGDGYEHGNLQLSTLNVFNYDGTKLYVKLFGGTRNGEVWTYNFDPSAMTSTGRDFQLTTPSWPTTVDYFYLQWDWSGTANNTMYTLGFGSYDDLGSNITTLETSRRIVSVNTSTGVVATVKDFASLLRTSGTVTTSTSSTVFAASGFTVPETLDNWCAGMGIKFTSGARSGEFSKITSFASSTKTFTLTTALTGAPGVSATFDLIPLGYMHSFTVSKDGDYFAWTVSEGQSDRGEGGQDAGRTFCHYRKSTDTFKKRQITSSEIVVTGSATVGGAHALELTGDGVKCTVSMTGGASGRVHVWDPFATDTIAAAGSGDVSTIIANCQHRGVLTNGIVHLDNSVGATLEQRLFSAPSTQTPVWVNPNKQSTHHPAWGCDYYLSAVHASQSYVYGIYNFTSGGDIHTWTLDSGAIYKSSGMLTNQTDSLALTSANNGCCYLNDRQLTRAASKAAMVAGTYFHDTVASPDVLYVWGHDSQDLTVSYSGGSTTTGSVTGGTTTVLTTNLASAVNDIYKGRLIEFSDFTMRRITGYNGTTKAVTVDTAVLFTPSAQSFTIHLNTVKGYDQRQFTPGVIWRAYVDNAADTNHYVRVCNSWSRLNVSYANASAGFTQQTLISSSRDGSLVAMQSNFDGGNRMDILVAKIDTTDPNASSGIRYTPMRWP